MRLLRLGSAVVMATAAQQAATLPRVTFTDVTAAAGIRFQHTSGAFGKKYLPETMGSGVAVLDADGDGRQDLFFVNAMKWPGRPGPASYPALYRNRGDGTFADDTRAAGLQVEMYGMGAASADFDNDGRADLYVTALGRNHLFRNAGGGRFVDVTEQARVADPGFSTSAAWLDYDRDGFLDLFVAHYVEWSIDKDLFCSLDGTRKSYCTPESYHGQSSTLFHNTGHGTFDNVTRAAGLYDANAKALGVALLDYDGDGWIDLFVANDRQPNRLYRNARNGTFRDVGLTAGVAFDETGTARAGMGVDAADYDGSGRDSIAIGNFSNEMMSLYTSEGHGLFIDRAPATAIGRSSLLKLTFGLFFFDYDLDGRPDLFAANGHVADDIAGVQRNVTYAQAPDLYWNAGMRRFEDAGRQAGADFQRAMVARGAAYTDYDADGDLDIVVTANKGPARLLRNDGGNANNWLRVSAIGGPAPSTPRPDGLASLGTSNRDAIGSRLQAVIDGKPGPSTMVKSGSSYGSQSERPVTFGLGRATKVSALMITWPDGRVERVPAIDANQAITLQEGRGVVRTARASR